MANTRKRPPATEEGDELPAIDPKSDVGMLVALLEWGRDRGFQLGPTIQVGAVTVQVRDMRIDRDKPERNAEETDIFTEHGHNPNAT